jgi:hypothetical protein
MVDAGTGRTRGRPLLGTRFLTKSRARTYRRIVDAGNPDIADACR